MAEKASKHKLDEKDSAQKSTKKLKKKGKQEQKVDREELHDCPPSDQPSDPMLAKAASSGIGYHEFRSSPIGSPCSIDSHSMSAIEEDELENNSLFSSPDGVSRVLHDSSSIGNSFTGEYSINPADISLDISIGDSMDKSGLNDPSPPASVSVIPLVVVPMLVQETEVGQMQPIYVESQLQSEPFLQFLQSFLNQAFAGGNVEGAAAAAAAATVRVTVPLPPPATPLVPPSHPLPDLPIPAPVDSINSSPLQSTFTSDILPPSQPDLLFEPTESTNKHQLTSSEVEMEAIARFEHGDCIVKAHAADVRKGSNFILVQWEGDNVLRWINKSLLFEYQSQVKFDLLDLPTLSYYSD